MPAASLSDLGLADKNPQELEALRRELMIQMTTEYKGYNDPEVPVDLLHQLAIITQALRRKNSGPPKDNKKKRAAKATTTTDDFVI